MTNYFTITSIVFIITIIFTLTTFVGDEITNNSNLDTQSQTLITSINYKVDTEFSANDFNESESISENASFEGQEAFEREFLESKSSAQTKTNILQRAVKIPELLLLALGIPKTWFLSIYLLILSFIAIVISIATFNAFFNKQLNKR